MNEKSLNNGAIRPELTKRPAHGSFLYSLRLPSPMGLRVTEAKL